MDDRTYLLRHGPPGARSGHDVLFDFGGHFRSFSPDAAAVEACLADLLPILQRVQVSVELYNEGHDATELALTIVARAREKCSPMPRGGVVSLVLAEIAPIQERTSALLRHRPDSSKRLDGIAELLQDPTG